MDEVGIVGSNIFKGRNSMRMGTCTKENGTTGIERDWGHYSVLVRGSSIKENGKTIFSMAEVVWSMRRKSAYRNLETSWRNSKTSKMCESAGKAMKASLGKARRTGWE
jgi:hypothetical protein